MVSLSTSIVDVGGRDPEVSERLAKNAELEGNRRIGKSAIWQVRQNRQAVQGEICKLREAWDS